MESQVRKGSSEDISLNDLLCNSLIIKYWYHFQAIYTLVGPQQLRIRIKIFSNGGLVITNQRVEKTGQDSIHSGGEHGFQSELIKTKCNVFHTHVYSVCLKAKGKSLSHIINHEQ